MPSFKWSAKLLQARSLVNRLHEFNDSFINYTGNGLLFKQKIKK